MALYLKVRDILVVTPKLGHSCRHAGVAAAGSSSGPDRGGLQVQDDGYTESKAFGRALRTLSRALS